LLTPFLAFCSRCAKANVSFNMATQWYQMAVADQGGVCTFIVVPAALKAENPPFSGSVLGSGQMAPADRQAEFAAVQSSSPDAAWQAIFDRIRYVRERISHQILQLERQQEDKHRRLAGVIRTLLSAAPPVPDARGLELFGLNHPAVRELVQRRADGLVLPSYRRITFVTSLA
jgi:F/Y rich C-terminus